MRLHFSREHQDKFHIRAKGRIDTVDAFARMTQKVARTVVSSEIFPGSAGIEEAITQARNMGVSTRAGMVSHELRVDPVVTLERAALRLGPLTMFVTAEKIPFAIHPPVADQIAPEQIAS
jgi:hypothetical protein